MFGRASRLAGLLAVIGGGCSPAAASSGAGGARSTSTSTLPTSTSPSSAGSGLVSGSSSASSGGCVGCARDWAAFPAIVEIDGATDLWAVSDVHGDYKAFTKLLAAAKLIASNPSTPAAASWTGAAATLVVVGDLIDKGPDAPDVVRLLAALATQAEAAGGHVVATMGNHEAEFLADPNNSKATASAGLDPELEMIGFTPEQTAAGDNDVGAFIRHMPFAARVDDWFFVHAGNTHGGSLIALENALRADVDAMGFGAPILSDASSMLETKLNSSAPQWWDATGDPVALLTQWTAVLGSNHLVMGHQPGAVGLSGGKDRPQDQMFKAYGGLLFLIDTGLSADVDATGGALLHVSNAGMPSDTYEAVFPDGSRSSL